MAILPRLTALLLGYVSRLRFPTLLAITALLFLMDLVIPDAIPLADEVLLGLATALLASWRRRDPAEDENAGPA